MRAAQYHRIANTNRAMNKHLPPGKTAHGYFPHHGEHLPVVRNTSPGSASPGTGYMNPRAFHACYSYTVWENGFARQENFSHKTWLHLVEIKRAYEGERVLDITENP